MHLPPYSKELFDFLYEYITEHKKALFEQILLQRTNHVAIVMENIFHSQNVSAILRTAECFGVQPIYYVAEKYGAYDLNPRVTRGASKWLNIHKLGSSEEAVKQLKQKGYKILTTAPAGTATPIHELDISQKTAFVFGEEAEGVSNAVTQLADDQVTIPMVGFTESFNVSVSAGICMHNFLTRLRSSEVAWQLSEEEKQLLRFEWSYKSARNAPSLVRYFEEQQSNS